MTTKRPDRKLPAGIKVVRKRLADGTLKEYCYVRASMAPLKHPRTGERLGPDADPQIIEGALRSAQRQARPVPQVSTIVDIVDDYRLSPEFKRLAPNTADRYGRALDRISDKFAFLTVDDLGKRKVRNLFYIWRDEMADRPATADQSIDVLCTLLQWAYRRGRIEVNHAHGIEPLRPPEATRRDKIWTPEIEQKLLKIARPEIRHAYLLARYTALRQADLCALEWGKHFDGEWIEIVPEKTKRLGVRVYIPVYALPPLVELVKELPKEGRLLRTRTGAPMNGSNLRLRFALEMEKAGLEEVDLHFHDIRGTAINDMLAAGATNAEAASISGHVIAEGARAGFGAYADRSKAMALGAFRKWAAMLAKDGGNSGPQVIVFPGRG